MSKRIRFYTSLEPQSHPGLFWSLRFQPPSDPTIQQENPRSAVAVRPERSGDSCTQDRSIPVCCRYRSYFIFICFLIHCVVTLLGRSMGEPMARLMINWESMPMARLMENSTV